MVEVVRRVVQTMWYQSLLALVRHLAQLLALILILAGIILWVVPGLRIWLEVPRSEAVEIMVIGLVLHVFTQENVGGKQNG